MQSEETGNSVKGPEHTKTLLATFPVYISYNFSHRATENLQRLINLHYLGDKHCNKVDDNGKMVHKYPEKETEEFRNCHWSTSCGYQRYIMVNFYSDGSSEILGEANLKDVKTMKKLLKEWTGHRLNKN